jgi:hypothetical protein
MGIGSPRLHRQLVAAAVAIVGWLAAPSHAGAALGLADTVTQAVQSAPAAVAPVVADTTALAAPAVETVDAVAQPAVAATETTLGAVAHRVRPLPVPAHVVPAHVSTPRLVTAPPPRPAATPAPAAAPAAPAAPLSTHIAVPIAAAEPHRSTPARRPRGAHRSNGRAADVERPPVANTSVVRPSPSFPSAAGSHPRADVVALHPVRLGGTCGERPSGAAGGTGAGSAAAAPVAALAATAPLAVMRLALPQPRPRSHLRTLCLERPD